MEDRPLRILLVEDNEGDRELLRAALDEAGACYELSVAGRVEEGIALGSARNFDVLLLDLTLPDSAGLDTVAKASRALSHIPIVVLTGLNDDRVGVKAVQSGAQDYLVKGMLPGPLMLRTIRHARERHRMQEALRLASLMDELTGLYNRRGFITLAPRELAAAAYSKSPCLVLFADMDGLKGINDTHGHAAGDWSIRAAARCLRGSVRGEDLVARIGGDEFVALLPGAPIAALDRLRLALDAECDKLNAESGQPFKVSISLGGEELEAGSPADLEALLQGADSALYREKAEHRKSRVGA